MPTTGLNRSGGALFSFLNTSGTSDGVLRVGAPELERQASVLSPYGPGLEIELVAGFARGSGRTPEWVTVHDKETGFAMLQRGEIDVLVGFWGDVPRQPESSAATASVPIVGGKAYAHFNPVRISGTTAPGEDSATGEPEEIRKLFIPAQAGLPPGGIPIWTVASTPDGSSSGTENPAQSDQPFPVFSFITDGEDEGTDIVLLDPASYALWLPFMGEVDSKKINRKMPYRWFWRDDASILAASLDAFWKDPERTHEVAELMERYFGFLPRTLRQHDILDLAEALSSRLPLYETFIMNAARETGVPPLLLVAAIFQESRFDPDAVSATRVRGIMQLTTATAQMLGVDRKDPAQCIMGGARYLRDLWEQMDGKAESDWDRWFMALAAYNQGMSNVNKAVRLAQAMGQRGTSWADLKRVFPLVTTCRGKEAKAFVERIRYYHFILHGLVALAPAETQDFAPLLGLAVADAEF